MRGIEYCREYRVQIRPIDKTGFRENRERLRKAATNQSYEKIDRIFVMYRGAYPEYIEGSSLQFLTHV
jgi:hypothetical protein